MSPSASLPLLLADLVLCVHLLFVAFVVLGLPTIWLGGWRRWGFVRNGWFRLGHLVAIAFVAAEAMCGVPCPLTVWEDRLRLRAGGGEQYAGSFVQHWVHRILFYEAPEQLFTFLYLAFLLAVLATLWWVQPHWPWKARSSR